MHSTDQKCEPALPETVHDHRERGTMSFPSLPNSHTLFRPSPLLPPLFYFASTHHKTVPGKMPADSATSDINANPITIGSIVFYITEDDTTIGIRLIDLPDFVSDFRKLSRTREPLVRQSRGNAKKGTHIFNLQSSWLDKFEDPRTWRLMTAVFKYMTGAGWAMIKTTQWWYLKQFTLFFQF